MYKLVESCSTTKRNEIPAILAILAEWTFLLKCSKQLMLCATWGGSWCFFLINPAIFQCSNMFLCSPRKLRKMNQWLTCNVAKILPKLTTTTTTTKCLLRGIYTHMFGEFQPRLTELCLGLLLMFYERSILISANSKRDVVTFPLCWLRWPEKKSREFRVECFWKRCHFYKNLFCGAEDWFNPIQNTETALLDTAFFPQNCRIF